MSENSTITDLIGLVDALMSDNLAVVVVHGVSCTVRFNAEPQADDAHNVIVTLINLNNSITANSIIDNNTRLISLLTLIILGILLDQVGLNYSELIFAL